MPLSDPTPEELARAFHETYDRLAPSYGHKPWTAAAEPWLDVPMDKRMLMTAVAGDLLAGILLPMLENARKIEEARDRVKAVEAKAIADGVIIDRIRDRAERIAGGLIIVPDDQAERPPRRWWRP